MVNTESSESPALLATARQGDSEAFGELCLFYQARLIRQAMVLCENATAAEDLAQETFLAAWRSLARYNGKCLFFTWLCSILIHLHKRRVRANHGWWRWEPVTPGAGEENDPLLHLPDAIHSPDQELALSERAALLRQHLDRLSPKHREVIFLRFYVHESLEGISEALHCSVGTVKSRLYHGLERLRKMKGLDEILDGKEKYL
ncbi:sigma-70 family RNA polymerase sigma factor [bacterium]|nr:MAG: sigma-70 family RNA polymerase sigma factor [bacterium]